VRSPLLRRAAAVTVLALCAVYAVLPPARGQERFVDQVINRETVQSMRAGAGYYPAMDKALRRHGGAVSSVRAFRMPTVFLLWRVLPGPRAVWLLFVGLVAVTALMFLDLTSAPFIVPFVAWYLLNAARPHIGGALVDQDMIVELWVVPLAAGVLWAWRRTRWGLAAGLAAAATLVRELAAGLVAGGLLAAQVLRRPRWPWLAAGAAVVAGVGVHSALASGHLVAHGSEIALLGTGGPDRVATMMGVGMRHPLVLGPLIWALAVGRLATDRELRLLFLFYITLPLTGFLVGRDYWGFMVAPFSILWAGEAVVAIAEKFLTGRRPRAARDDAPPARTSVLRRS
jgi:hypothetical protein